VTADLQEQRTDPRPLTVGPRAPTPLTVLGPWAVLGCLLAVVLRFSALRLGNQDTWFHLVLGDRFRHGAGLGNPAGLTPFATSRWVPTQWSTELLASWTEDRFGLPGVAWLFGACYLALVLVTYVACRRQARPMVAASVVVPVVLGVAPALSARPQVVSLVLLAVTVAAWLRTVDDGRARWWLVPLTWGWATAHGLWSAGVLLGVVCCFGLVLDRRHRGRPSWAVLAVPVAQVVAALLTPVGPRLLSSQLAVSARTSLIPEWGPPSFRSVPSLSVALMIALTLVLWARIGRVSWTRLALLLLAAAWTLTVARMVALGAVVAAPLLAGAVEQALAATGRGTGLGRRVARGERNGLLLLALGYLLVLAVAAPRAVTGPADVPSGLVPELEGLPAGSSLLVEDGIGAWVEWRTPEVSPVIDGLLDAYPVAYIRRFFAATRVEPGWRGFVAGSRARAGILDAGSPLSAALHDQLGWRTRARDGRWVFMVAPEAPGR
jgi:hypothetical protein